VAFIDIFAALDYLAGRGLIHRDIKPKNVLVVVETMRLVKCLLADFGESKMLPADHSRVRGTIAGTPDYMAPEMREAEEAISPKVDVFSAGVVVIEVNSGLVPDPGPLLRNRVAVPEEQRRAASIASMRYALCPAPPASVLPAPGLALYRAASPPSYPFAPSPVPTALVQRRGDRGDC
jgi:serine/threonine protein kinase